MKDFQELILEELRSLKDGQKRLEERQISFEERQISFEERMISFEERMISFEERMINLEKKMDAVYEQTADLIEFRTETNKKLDGIIENQKSIYELVGEHEVAIRTLRRRPV